MSSPRLCILDTDSGFVRLLQKRSQVAGWEVRVLTTVPRLEDLVAMRMNALVLDLARSGPESWEFLERVCTTLPELGLIVCTSEGGVRDRVRALRLGADDWVGKPCHPEEVLARIEAVVRRRKRAQVKADVGPLTVGEVEVRVDQYQAFVGGKSAELTRLEFELLLLLAEAKGRVLAREEIYRRVWGYAMAHGDRSVDVYVRKLRRKLERLSSDWQYIHTHFGIGYRLHAEPLIAGEPGERPQSALESAPQEMPSIAQDSYPYTGDAD